ncbi:predicted protein [Nematostella vectensis]|uniref:G-protein coupled receptors family 1 profile domain-containing protein n=1 Tax=Nematostella vectensis TaxID=45351 RepID=A7RM70_NEMVE|nr:predicted protein [Nematostella vectensis]|eukprot:XP_001639516.1 predicted protein [Nematostella vectensis]
MAVNRYYRVVIPDRYRNYFTTRRVYISIAIIIVIASLGPGMAMMAQLSVSEFHYGKLICFMDTTAVFSLPTNSLPPKDKYLAVNVKDVTAPTLPPNADKHLAVNVEDFTAPALPPNADNNLAVNVENVTAPTLQPNAQMHLAVNVKDVTAPNVPPNADNNLAVNVEDFTAPTLPPNADNNLAVNVEDFTAPTVPPNANNNLAVIVENVTAPTLPPNAQMHLAVNVKDVTAPTVPSNSDKHSAVNVKDFTAPTLIPNAQMRLAVNVEDVKVTKTLFVTVVGFIVCWAPIAVIDMVGVFFSHLDIPREVYLAYILLGYGSSSINPFIYGILNRSFRREFINILSFRRRSRIHLPVIGKSKVHAAKGSRYNSRQKWPDISCQE